MTQLAKYAAQIKKRMKCECSDPHCPVHNPNSECINTVAEVLYRVDMEDQYGTRMCEGCADDAYGSGLFTDKVGRK